MKLHDLSHLFVFVACTVISAANALCADRLPPPETRSPSEGTAPPLGAPSLSPLEPSATI